MVETCAGPGLLYSLLKTVDINALHELEPTAAIDIYNPKEAPTDADGFEHDGTPSFTAKPKPRKRLPTPPSNALATAVPP